MNVSFANATGLSNLIIPHNVIVTDNFSANSKLNISGTFSNAGAFVAAASGTGVVNASINANLIENLQGGLLSSNLGNLSLVSLTSIANSGVIQGSGALTLSAGTSIANTLPTGSHGATPLIQATNSLNLFTGTGTVLNTGVLQSTSGNLNISTVTAMSGLQTGIPTPTSLTVLNYGGVLDAQKGNINIGDASLVSKINTSVLGGDALSNEFNIFSGNGSAIINMNNITGIVNVNAGLAHIDAAAPNLVLGSMNLSGDPTFYNTAGNVILNSASSWDFTAGAGADLAIVASGDIISDDSSGTGFSIAANNITMLAGAQFTSSGTSTTLNGSDSSSVLKVTGNSVTGGRIDLSNFQTAFPGSLGVTQITANGNLIMAAAAGTTSNSGQVVLPNGTNSNIFATGDISVIAGAKTGSAITIGIVRAGTGSATTNGNISLQNYQPTYNNVSILDGTVSGTISPNISSGPAGGNIVITGVLSPGSAGSAGGNVSVNAGGAVIFGPLASAQISTVSTGSSAANGGSVQLTGSDIQANNINGLQIQTNGANGGEAGNIYISTTSRSSNLVLDNSGAPGTIQIRALGNDGAVVEISAGGNLTVNQPAASLTAATAPGNVAGNGAQIYLAAGASGAGNLQINGDIDASAHANGSANGGTIVLASNSSSPFVTNSAASPTNGINGLLTANAGTSGGANGGTVAIINAGSGGVKFSAAGDISVSANATQNPGTNKSQ